MIQPIGTLQFTPEDIDRFAYLSGDYNPIHVDQVQARRLLTGEQAVHGILTLLSVLEAYARFFGAPISKMSVKFRHSVSLGKLLHIIAETEANHVSIRVMDGVEEVVYVDLVQAGQSYATLPYNRAPERASPKTPSFADMRSAKGVLPVECDAEALNKSYPNAYRVCGLMVLAGLMSLSRLVGMECPGMHSLFVGLEVICDAGITESELRWHVEQAPSAYAPIRIGVRGAHLQGEITAVIRPEPVRQPTMRETIQALGNDDMCRGDKVLIAGGSRGLGEITAKICAAKGADVVITYHLGKAEADRIAMEITASGFQCRTMHYDASKPMDLEKEIIAQPWRPTHAYFFPSARIKKSTADRFDSNAFTEYCDMYVSHFEHFAEILAKLCGHITLFYPSTVYIDEQPKNFAEYIKAKSAGEALCATLSRRYPQLNLLIERLPRLSTDQNMSLIPARLPPTLPIMEQVVKRMHHK